MNLIALAVPFFILSVLAEFLADRWRRTGYYRSNDAINSISAGTLSQTTGYFTKVCRLHSLGLRVEQLGTHQYG